MKHLVFILIPFFLLPFFACKDSSIPTACECQVNAQHVSPDSTVVTPNMTLPPVDSALGVRCGEYLRALSYDEMTAWYKESDDCEYFTFSFKKSLSGEPTE